MTILYTLQHVKTTVFAAAKNKIKHNLLPLITKQDIGDSYLIKATTFML